MSNSVAGPGFSDPTEFARVTEPLVAIDTLEAKIVYDTITGRLFYNQNGSALGQGTGGHFATLSDAPNVTAADFTLA
jgi:hypothetical protein